MSDAKPLTKEEEAMLRARAPDSTTGTGLVHRLLATLDEARARIAEVERFYAETLERQAIDRALHSAGRCICGGEGVCLWCRSIEHQARAEEAEARVAVLEAALKMAEAGFGHYCPDGWHDCPRALAEIAVDAALKGSP